MREPSDLVGSMIGQYQILEELGRGGMAIVYKAWQATLQRHVAIKVLFPHLASAEFVQRFKQEAVVAANLSHPNIVTIYEVGEQNGSLYIVMEYIAGRSLSDILAQDGIMPLPRLVQILAQVAEALDYAHQRHFIHRDIKPANILVTAEDRAIITDFGIAKALEGSGATAQLTSAGTIMGTPAYMSPEQIQGLPIGYQTDLYSLGIVCYELLGGRPPFNGTTTAAVLYSQVNSEPPGIRQINPSVPRGVERALARMLAKRPEDRFPSARAFVASLSGQEVTETPVRSAAGRTTRSNTQRTTGKTIQPEPISTNSGKKKSSALPILLGAAAIVVALILVVLVLVLTNNPQPTPTPVQILASNTPTSVVAVVDMSTPEPSPTPADAPLPATPGRYAGLTSDLAFDSNRDGDYDIYILTAGSGDLQQITNDPAEDVRPDWSPDGQQIAFQSDRDGNLEIYVMDRQGSNVRRLTVSDGRDMKPDWSPDGQKILFESDRDGNPELYVMDADGRNPIRLTNDPGRDWAPAWSPSGDQIVFMSNRDTEDKTYEIYIMQSDGSGVRRLTNNQFEDFEPRWSPDGRRIVFSSDRAEENWDIYVMDVGGESMGLVRLTTNPGKDSAPSWSADGRSIAFVSDQEGNNRIYIMDPDGSQQVAVTLDSADSGQARWLP